jgi:hypothetical protein
MHKRIVPFGCCALLLVTGVAWLFASTRATASPYDNSMFGIPMEQAAKGACGNQACKSAGNYKRQRRALRSSRLTPARRCTSF